MQTLFRLLELGRDLTEDEILRLIDEEANSCIVNGDLLGAGEWLASRLNYSEGSDPDALTAKILALWASSSELSFSPSGMRDLIENMHLFDRTALCTSLVGLSARRPRLIAKFPELLGDIGFRLGPDIGKRFEVKAARQVDLLGHGAARLDGALSTFLKLLKEFQNTHCISARIPAMDLLKQLRQLKPLLVIHEHPLLSSIESLLGPGFREFCISYERGETQKVVLRLPDIRQQAQDALGARTYESSVIWQLVVKPIAEHLIKLLDEASRASKLALTPAIKLSSNTFKSDLEQEDGIVTIPARIVNEGAGNATRVRLDPSVLAVTLVSPKDPFTLSAGADRIIQIKCKPSRGQAHTSMPIVWLCNDLSGQRHAFEDELRLEQQQIQPDWQQLKENPPYTVNPIKTRQRLFGRGPQLDKLLMSAAAGTSTFVWGQKRVGKTSLLQVIQEELSRKTRFGCMLLRMGQLAAMHEGQLAHTIATRLASMVPSCKVATPTEPEFGAGLGRLIPFVETLTATHDDWRFVVIVDEFDDLDPAFYSGERGRLFVKALRSLSEIGLTFMFTGSERMNVIYARHALELNKWVNTFVDSITSLPDCRDLIAKPVNNQLEFEQLAVDGIADYCSGNPFFIHLVCLGLFERCVAERRTYISDADFQSNRQVLISTLGQTNFAHFWEDNPTLDRDENRRFAAENCLTLCCISSLRTSFDTIESVWERQDSLNLTSTERLSVREMTIVIERLRSRKILTDPQSDGRVRVGVPILAEWLAKHAELTLLPVWRRFVEDRKSQAEIGSEVAQSRTQVFEPSFPISEDDLLPVSQNLIFCGKQKDVAEIRSWLRQFDDDNRIEIAFALLRRLTEKGYVSDGAREYSLAKAVEGITARRLEVGLGKWGIVRGRKDNLCLSYLDSTLKSGADLTRDVVKRLAPGKSGDAKEISNWLASHAESDSILVLLDDFSATGSTICGGFQKWKSEIKDSAVIERYLDERRLMLVLLYSFADATDAIRDVDSRIKIFSSNIFGSDVKAFDPEAGIFADAEEIAFAREVMLQIGRELTPQSPLGFGDQGMLITFHNTVPNNTLPVFWSNGRVNERNWKPLFSRV